MKKIVVASFTVIGILIPGGANAATYKNCTAMNKAFPHGVAKSVAAAGVQKNAPKISAKIYNAHIKMDRDKDGTVCEK